MVRQYYTVCLTVRGRALLILLFTGDIFSRKVKLGGKLTSTSEVDSESSGSETVRENSMKAAAAASFSGFYGSASAEASYEEGGQHKDGSNKQGFSSQLTWAAVGGDTTLCNE
jgi:hypothetical protein